MKNWWTEEDRKEFTNRTKLRVNVNLPQFDKFYETYSVKEGDFMYTAPEDRLKVW